MVCLENEQEIPAWKWEVDEAVEEAIKINYRWGPKAVKREGDKVMGLEVTKVLSVFDANKRFAPTFDNNVTTLLEADTIIITIGQMSNLIVPERQRGQGWTNAGASNGTRLPR